MHDRGILSEPLDVDAPQRRGPDYRAVPAENGLVVEHQATGTMGSIVRFAPPQVIVRDTSGRDHAFRLHDGAFLVDGAPVALKTPPPEIRAESMSTTASGSIGLGAVPARMARASRIYVEGIHDAELIEHVWGDDLRIEGVVVQQVEGIDDLEELVRGFGPGPRRRLGVLVDHLVSGSKESRIAAKIDHPDVLICGHPFVDIWQGVKPATIGIEKWPEVPLGEPWKEGILSRIGFEGSSGAFWKYLRNQVRSYRDLEPTLIGAVEQLIDFVAPPE
ncbi:MAG: DUF3097 family protein [Acidimicrobiales bacterium]